MSRKKSAPTYRLHKASGQAVATFDHRDHYLGKFDTPKSRAKYSRLLAEWYERGQSLPPAPQPATIAQLAARFLEHAQSYYRRRDGTVTSEPEALAQALRPLLKLYARLPAAEFSPLKLIAVRDAMITWGERGWCRTVINREIHRVRRMFKWGAERELVPATVYQALTTVAALAEGRSGARETEPVGPVPAPTIEATVAQLSSQVAAMVKLQLLTGMRSGELVSMRTCDINMRTGEPNPTGTWIYTPASHKMQYRGRPRPIPLGPRCQEILRPWLKADLQAFIFSPADSVEERYQKATAAAKGKSKRGRPRRRGRLPGLQYTPAVYLRAVQRGCDRAFALPDDLAAADALVKKWENKWTYAHDQQPRLEEYPEDLRAMRGQVDAYRSAHRFRAHALRHTRTDEIKALFGLDGSRAVLGHSSVSTTEIYATRDLAMAEKIMAEIG